MQPFTDTFQQVPEGCLSVCVLDGREVVKYGNISVAEVFDGVVEEVR